MANMTYAEYYDRCEPVMIYELGTHAKEIFDDDLSAMIQWFGNACLAADVDPRNDFTGGTICRAIRNAYFAGYDAGYEKGYSENK